MAIIRRTKAVGTRFYYLVTKRRVAPPARQRGYFTIAGVNWPRHRFYKNARQANVRTKQRNAFVCKQRHWAPPDGKVCLASIFWLWTYVAKEIKANALKKLILFVAWLKLYHAPKLISINIHVVVFFVTLLRLVSKLGHRSVI